MVARREARGSSGGGWRLSTLRRSVVWFMALSLGIMMAIVAVAQAGDRHVGYYYPEPQTSETYVARIAPLEGNDRRVRVKFVTELTNSMLETSPLPEFALFAKGEYAQKLIITSLRNGSLDTIYRMRGLLAILTARARSTELFRELGVEDVLTFFDLLRLLGFERLTVTDGQTFAHRIEIQ